MDKNDKVFVAGPRGLVGSAIVRRLAALGYSNVLTPGHKDLELLDAVDVAEYFEHHRPDYVIIAAARVGGILANSTYPAEFIYQNLMIQNHLIHQSWQAGVKKLIFLGSSCIYPKLCDQPMKEESLMSGPLEPTNSAYAIAKIAGIEMCWAYNRQHGTNFIPVMPTNLYGPNDNFDLETSHVLPALIRKFHEAKACGEEEVVVWGTGTPKREFLHVDDLANACCFLLENEIDPNAYGDKPLFNIGCGKEVSIAELADIVKEIVGFSGRIVYDSTKPDGTPRKLLEVSRMSQLGWQAGVDLKMGLKKTYQWFQETMVS